MECNAFSVIATLLFSCCLLHRKAAAQAPADDDQPPTIRLTVSPAAEPKPALKYRFLVPPVDQIEGNAATFYYKAMVFEGEDPIDQFWRNDNVSKWMEMPLAEMPRNEVDQATDWLRWIDEDLANAAACDTCDWKDNIREHGVYTLLPQPVRYRALGTGIALRARLQIAQGKYNEATETLRIGYVLSRNLGQGPFIVQTLIGMAIRGMMDDQIQAAIDSVDSPNLYWALTELAANPVSFHKAFSYESRFWPFTVHDLDNLEDRRLDAEETLKLSLKIWDVIGFTTGSKEQGLSKDVALLVWAVQLHAEARKYLIQHGYGIDVLDAMPVLQIVLLYRWRQFEEVRDDAFKWSLLPSDEALEFLDRPNEIVLAAARTNTATPFIDLLPAMSAAIEARLRRQRTTNILRTIEALRMHAAAHGQWPMTLNEVTMVPIPQDPWNQQPFEYAVADGVAILATSNTDKRHWELSAAKRFELVLRKPQHPSK